MILITDSLGFVGYHLNNRILSLGLSVIGIDSRSNYYSVELKKGRLMNLFSKSTANNTNYMFYHVDISSIEETRNTLKQLEETSYNAFLSIFINIAAQAGIRYLSQVPQIIFPQILELTSVRHRIDL